ncbi:MAG: CBS domain-containing protein [Candidatus Altiarchaeota archaeon]
MEIRVGDVMTKGVICISPKDSVQVAAELMKEHDIDSVLVMDGTKGVGIVTERDIICKIVAEREDPKKTPVSASMASPLITIGPDEDIDEAARIMRNENIRRLVVMDSDNIVGIISDFDITKVEPALHLLIEEKSKWNISDISNVGEGRITGECEECGNYSENLSSGRGRLLCADCISE